MLFYLEGPPCRGRTGFRGLGKMAFKFKPGQMNSLRAAQTANIPTTIKNPERLAHRRTELIEQHISSAPPARKRRRSGPSA